MKILLRHEYFLSKDFSKRYADAFNDYALDIMYGGNIVIGDDIEDEYKDQ